MWDRIDVISENGDGSPTSNVIVELMLELKAQSNEYHLMRESPASQIMNLKHLL